VEDICLLGEHKLKIADKQNWKSQLEKFYTNGKPLIPHNYSWWKTTALGIHSFTIATSSSQNADIGPLASTSNRNNYKTTGDMQLVLHSLPDFITPWNIWQGMKLLRNLCLAVFEWYVPKIHECGGIRIYSSSEGCTHFCCL
jgi:hypothetical protein